MTQKVVVYATPFCPYCVRARRLLESKGVDYELKDAEDPQIWQEMEEKSGRHTVPQIWIGKRHVGGSDDLVAADRAGLLDQWLAEIKEEQA